MLTLERKTEQVVFFLLCDFRWFVINENFVLDIAAKHKKTNRITFYWVFVLFKMDINRGAPSKMLRERYWRKEGDSSTSHRPVSGSVPQSEQVLSSVVWYIYAYVWCESERACLYLLVSSSTVCWIGRWFAYCVSLNTCICVLWFVCACVCASVHTPQTDGQTEWKQ